ncbi:hypothetical protein [Fortiea contorta]|uniref:hypothetical protein n=1 Tax=Fortiea contorta TaxID=1892405 RepID=UPI00034C6C6C|nr:hypothetical protein [Fortiea contorta]
MGILSRITSAAGKSSNKESQSSLATGGHAIDKNRVLAPTDPTAINPLNAGAWESVRTAPVSDVPRYFTKPEADALKELATEKTQGAKQSQRAYKSLGKIEAADAAVHKHHRNYIRGTADAELTKKRADASTARHLHALRPEYAKLGLV